MHSPPTLVDTERLGQNQVSYIARDIFLTVNVMSEAPKDIDWKAYQGRPLSELLFALRTQRDMTMEQFGSIAGVERQTVGFWEKGTHAPRTHAARDKLRKALNIDGDPELLKAWTEACALHDANDRRRGSPLKDYPKALSDAKNRAVSVRRDIALPPSAQGAHLPSTRVQDRIGAIGRAFVNGESNFSSHLTALEHLYLDLQSLGKLDSVKAELLDAVARGDQGAFWSYAQIVEGEVLCEPPLDDASQERLLSELETSDPHRFAQVFSYVRAHAILHPHRTGEAFSHLKDRHIDAIVDGASMSGVVFPLALQLIDQLTAPSSVQTVRNKVSSEAVAKIMSSAVRLKLHETACTSASLIVANAIAYTDYQDVALKVADLISSFRGGTLRVERSLREDPEAYIRIIHEWMDAATDEQNRALMAIALSRLGVITDDLLETVSVLLKKPTLIDYLNVEAIAILVLSGKRSCSKTVFRLVEIGRHQSAFEAACLLGFFGDWRLNLAMAFSRNRELSFNVNEAAMILTTSLRTDIPAVPFFIRALRGRGRYFWNWVKHHRSMQTLKDGGEFFYHNLHFTRGKTSRALWDMRLFVCKQTIVAAKIELFEHRVKEKWFAKFRPGRPPVRPNPEKEEAAEG